jgi:hypothetical protein
MFRAQLRGDGVDNMVMILRATGTPALSGLSGSVYSQSLKIPVSAILRILKMVDSLSWPLYAAIVSSVARGANPQMVG